MNTVNRSRSISTTVERDRLSMHIQANVQTPNFARRRLVALAVVASLFGAASDHIASHDQEFCTTTPGANTVWNNGQATVDELREMGAKIDSIADVIDPLAAMPNYQGQREGISVCATQTTGVIGSLIGADISIG